MSITSTMQFKSFEVYKITYSLSNERLESEIDFFLKEFPDYSENICDILFGIHLIDSNRDDNKTLTLDIAIKGHFVLEEALTEEIVSKLIIPNGTAILFPYLRTLVSTITGYDTLAETIILPTVNIPKLLKSNKIKNNNR